MYIALVAYLIFARLQNIILCFLNINLRILSLQQASVRQPKYSYLVSKPTSTSSSTSFNNYRDSSYNTEQRKAVTSYPTSSISTYQVRQQRAQKYLEIFDQKYLGPRLQLHQT